MTSASFAHIARTSASTKRPPVISGGKSGAPTAHLTGLKCTRIIPPGNAQELLVTLGLSTQVELFETHLQTALDILTGDTFTADGVEYLVRLSQTFPLGASDVRIRLVLERARR